MTREQALEAALRFIERIVNQGEPISNTEHAAIQGAVNKALHAADPPPARTGTGEGQLHRFRWDELPEPPKGKTA